MDPRDSTRGTSAATRLSQPGSSTSSLQEAAASASQGEYARRRVPFSNDTIRVLLVDDHAIVRSGLRALLHPTPDIRVVGEAANGKEAVVAARQFAPDVVVMDLGTPVEDGEAATVELSRLEPAQKVLILTMHAEEERLVSVLENGASGYLSKDCADHDLIDAIRVVAASGEPDGAGPVACGLSAAASVPVDRPRSVPCSVEPMWSEARLLTYAGTGPPRAPPLAASVAPTTSAPCPSSRVPRPAPARARCRRTGGRTPTSTPCRRCSGG